MRVRSMMSTAVALTWMAALSWAGYASAQAIGLGSGPVFAGGMGTTSGSSFGPGAVMGLPYSLVETMTTVQTLADGTTITQVNEQRRMRDSEGRERTENGVMRDGALLVAIIHLQDPVARSFTTLLPLNKTAHVMRLPELKPEATEQDTKAAAVFRAKTEALRREHPAAPNSEDLAPQTVAGLYAEGKRHTLVIPAGQQGNDREIRVVTETWTSPELKIVVGRTTEDPRMGKTTMVISDLERAEPDPSLFQVPPDYRIIEADSTQSRGLAKTTPQ
jgi:hypothetical protein